MNNKKEFIVIYSNIIRNKKTGSYFTYLPREIITKFDLDVNPNQRMKWKFVFDSDRLVVNVSPELKESGENNGHGKYRGHEIDVVENVFLPEEPPIVEPIEIEKALNDVPIVKIEESLSDDLWNVLK